MSSMLSIMYLQFNGLERKASDMGATIKDAGGWIYNWTLEDGETWASIGLSKDVFNEQLYIRNSLSHPRLSKRQILWVCGRRA